MPPVVERPEAEAELVAVVRQAAAAGRPVTVGRPVGEQVGIDLARYGRLLRVDRDRGRATAEAGIPLSRLTRALGAWGLCMENGAGAATQRLGGAVSWAAHGTGAAFGGLVSQISALRLVTPHGDVVSCSDTEEPDIFAAARAGLGALGVISTVTVCCQPGFNLRAATATVDLDRALADFDRLADGNDHFLLSWRPGRGRAQVTTANRTAEPADGRRVDRAYRWFDRFRGARHGAEYSLPRPQAGAVLARLSQSTGTSGHRPPFPVVVSVTAGDNVPLSPAEGRPSVYIAGVAGLDGRPQWTPGLDPEPLRGLYPRFGEWEAVRDRLDPQRRFAYTSGQG